MEKDIAKLGVEMAHVKNKVNQIDDRLESMQLGSRMAVLEDRQGTVFRLIHGIVGIFGSIVSGIILWLFTKHH